MAKKLGRPKSKNPLGTTIGVRLDADTLQALDAFRGDRSRAAAARELIEVGLLGAPTIGDAARTALARMAGRNLARGQRGRKNQAG